MQQAHLGLYGPLLPFDCPNDCQPYVFAVVVLSGDHPRKGLACLRFSLTAVDLDHAVSRAIDALREIIGHDHASPEAGTGYS
jgi:hypothetical protein